MSHRRYKIKVGTFAGDILEGTPTGTFLNLADVETYHRDGWEKTQHLLRDPCGQHGVWIHKLNQRFLLTDVEDQHVPLDVLGNEIFVGSVVAYAKRNMDVSRMRITKIGDIGSGAWRGRKLYGIDLHNNKKTMNSYPSRCLLLA